MTPPRFLRMTALALGIFACVSTWSGCGGVPETGTQATPIDPEVAKQQGQAYESLRKGGRPR